jgi:hypothetical protein
VTSRIFDDWDLNAHFDRVKRMVTGVSISPGERRVHAVFSPSPLVPEPSS